VQPAPSYGQLCGPLAGRAFACLGAAPLAGPIRTETPWNALFEVAIFHTENSASYEVSLYPTLGVVPRDGWLGPRATVRAN
jgi:hypothetical protein